jgi:hypothetical protein
MTAFTVERTAPLQLVRTNPLTEMYTLSPFVWRGRLRYELLLRAVNHSEIAAEKVARIYYGQSEDGLRFRMGETGGKQVSFTASEVPKGQQCKQCGAKLVCPDCDL